MEISHILTSFEIDMLVRIGLGIILGSLIGLEKEMQRKSAGIRTMTFVVIGAMLFTSLGLRDTADSMRVAAQIVSGIGFLGAGLIMTGQDGMIHNVTTAATIRVAAAVGMSLGTGEYVVACCITLVIVLISNFPNAYQLGLQKYIKKTQREKIVSQIKAPAGTIPGATPETSPKQQDTNERFVSTFLGEHVDNTSMSTNKSI